MDSTVIQATIAAVIVALIVVWEIRYQRTGKLFWWRKPNPSPSKPPIGNHDSQLSDAYDLTQRGLIPIRSGYVVYGGTLG